MMLKVSAIDTAVRLGAGLYNDDPRLPWMVAYVIGNTSKLQDIEPILSFYWSNGRIHDHYVRRRR